MVVLNIPGEHVFNHICALCCLDLVKLGLKADEGGIIQAWPYFAKFISTMNWLYSVAFAKNGTCPSD